MRKHRKHAHVKHRKKTTSAVAVYALVLFFLAATVWYKHNQNNVLGIETGTGIDSGGVLIPLGESQPTAQIIQVTTVPPTQAPQNPPPTTIILPTETPQNPPIPTPSLIVPSEPVYVEIIDTPGGGGGTGGGNAGGGQVDIGSGQVTVVIENTPGGVTTTTEQLTPQTTVVGSTSTVITAQTGQNTAVAQQNVSAVDRLLSFFTGSSVSQSDSTVNLSPKAPVYAQIYIPSVSGATFVTDPTETISALNQWLGFNGITLKYLGDGSFSITQGDVVAIITPKDSKIAVNLSRMELMVNTETGFQPLSYLPGRVTDYLITGGHISKLSAPIKVVETPTELHLEMETTSTQHLFALIPVPVNVKYCMSATTLNPCGKEQGLLSKSLDFLSL